MSELNMLQAAANTSLNEVALEGAKTGFFAGIVEGGKELVKENPIAVAVGVTGLVVGGVMYYGYRNWGWFADEPSQVAGNKHTYTDAEMNEIISSAMAAGAAAETAATVAPVAPAAVAVPVA